jgi:hypothetical protein
MRPLALAAQAVVEQVALVTQVARGRWVLLAQPIQAEVAVAHRGSRPPLVAVQVALEL